MGVGKFEQSIESLNSDPCAGFTYAMHYAETQGKPGSKCFQKAKEYVEEVLGKKEAQKLFIKYRAEISRRNKSNGTMFYSK